MNKIKDENALHVKMFGNFSMTYQGESLLGGKAKESQFSSLMQLLLHNRENGISRELLEDVLFGDRDVADVHHALRTVIYNAKKKLEQSGFTGIECIVVEKSMIRWTDKIAVQEDAQEFEQFCLLADHEEDEDKKLQFWLAACHCYTGEFLSAYAAVIWAASEARRYRGMFCRCVEEAAEILRKKQDFLQLEQLGTYAAGISPFSDWELLTMEAYIGMGQFEAAYKLYADTADLYFKERGLRPSRKLMDTLDSLGSQFAHPFDVLDQIQTDLSEENPDDNAYLCSYPIFRGIYQASARMTKRSGQSIYLMLCTVVDSKGNPMKDSGQLVELSARLEASICRSIRSSDIVTHYGKGQYLILLTNITRENCSLIQKRINNDFIVGRQRTGIHYYANSILCGTD